MQKTGKFSDNHAERPNSDNVKRYAKRYQWLPDRPHRGFSCGGDVDAFGDESLYKPSLLGSAIISPCEVEAGALSPLTVTFTAGPAGVPEGTRVKLVIRGQSPLGRLPDFTLSCAATCELEQINMGFVVKKGCLNDGDVVRLDWPAFQWTPLAGRREFKVVFNYGAGRPEQRFPESLVVSILPKSCSYFNACLPCTHPEGQDIDVRVTARDEYDNRASYSGELQMETPQGSQKITLVDGIGSCRNTFLERKCYKDLR